MAEDPYLWLEDITGAEALAWVERHSQPTVEALTGYRSSVTGEDPAQIAYAVWCNSLKLFGRQN